MIIQTHMGVDGDRLPDVYTKSPPRPPLGNSFEKLAAWGQNQIIWIKG